MTFRPAYCPWCGEPIAVYGYEAHSQNILWERCKTLRCPGIKTELKTDPMGFVLEPANMRGKYVYARQRRRI